MKRFLDIVSSSWFFFAFGLYALIFFLPLPQPVSFFGIQIFELLTLLISGIVIYLAFQNNKFWKILSLVLTLAIFTLPMLINWSQVESNYNLVLGLLPWSDASGYYADALTLLQGGLFSGFSGNRPLFPSFLSLLLKLGAGNIQTALIVLALINGFAVYLFACEINAHLGALAGALATLLLYFFYRQFAGTLLTEQLGIPLGLIALTLLLRALKISSLNLFSTGLFCLALALFARAGAFFVLPALAMLGYVYFADRGIISIRLILTLVSALALAWGLNFFLGKIVSSPDVAQFGNFSYTLYGQAVGGRGWTQIFTDHPEISLLVDSEKARAAYLFAFAEIRRNPAGLAAGFINAWRDYFIPSQFAVFSFVQLGDKYSSPYLQGLLLLALFAGLFLAWKHRRTGTASLLLAAFLGILVSIPFIPPSESALMRVYSATIAIPIVLACSVVGGLAWGKVAHHSPDSKWNLQRDVGLACLAVFCIMGAVFGGPIVKILAPERLSLAEPTCSFGETPLQFQLAPAANILINANESGQPTKIPVVTARDFRKSMRKFPGIYHDFSDSLISLITPPVVLSYSQNLITGDFHWLINPQEAINKPGVIIQACGISAPQNSSIITVTSLK